MNETDEECEEGEGTTPSGFGGGGVAVLFLCEPLPSFSSLSSCFVSRHLIGLKQSRSESDDPSAAVIWWDFKSFAQRIPAFSELWKWRAVTWDFEVGSLHSFRCSGEIISRNGYCEYHKAAIKAQLLNTHRSFKFYHSSQSHLNCDTHLSIIVTMSAIKPRPQDYWVYRTQLWAVYDHFHLTDEHRTQSILNGLQRVEQSLIEDLGAQKSKANSPSALQPPSKRHPSTCNVNLWLHLDSWAQKCSVFK